MVKNTNTAQTVCRSVAEANMGGCSCIKAVTRYAVLDDVINKYSFEITSLTLKFESVILRMSERLQRGYDSLSV